METSRFVCTDQRTLEDIDDMKCNLCQKVAHHPTQCPSEHLFCSTCIQTHLKTTPTCPVDHAPLSPTTLHKSLLAEKVVSRLTIRCANAGTTGASHLVGAIRKRLRHPLGCRWAGKVRDLPAHAATCSFRRVSCPHCGSRAVPLVGLPAHVQSCVDRPETCHLCEAPVPAKELDRHYAVCPKAAVYCPNHCLLRPGGGTEVMLLRREDVEEHLRRCPRQMVDCEFRDMGCVFRGTRGEMPRHLREDMPAHLVAMRKALVDVRRVLAGRPVERREGVVVKKEAGVDAPLEETDDCVEDTWDIKPLSVP